MINSICPNMTLDQVVEKITLNPAWARSALYSLHTAPPKERATFALAFRELSAVLASLMAEEADAGWLTLIYYNRGIPHITEAAEAEMAGQADQTKEINKFIEKYSHPAPLKNPGTTTPLIDQIRAAATGLESGIPWPPDLTEKTIRHGTAKELTALINIAPMTQSEKQGVLSRIRSDNNGALPLTIYESPIISWSEIAEILDRQSIDSDIARVIARRTDLTPGALKKLSSLGDERTLIVLHDSQRSLLKDEHFQAMLDIDSRVLDISMAASPGTPHWVLLTLASRPYMMILMEIARRTDLPSDLLSRMGKVSSYLASVNVARLLHAGSELSKDEIKAGLTSDYKSVRVSTITKGVGKKR